MKKAIFIFFVLSMALSGCVSPDKTSTPLTENAVKLGTARVIVDLEVIRNVGDGDPVPPEIDVLTKLPNIGDPCVASRPIFSTNTHIKDEGMNVVKLEKKGNSFVGDVPVECIHELGTFCLRNDRGDLLGGFIVPLSQNDSTFVTFHFNEEGETIGVGVECSNWCHLTGLDLRVIAEILGQGYDYGSPHGWTRSLKEDLYESNWKDVRKVELDSIWPTFLESAIYRCKTYYPDEFHFRGMGIPKRAKSWVMNDLKIIFAVDEILPYSRRAGEALGRKVANPPMEAYSFLDSINYTPDVFLLAPVFIPQRYILQGILEIPGSGIESIGEKPVKEWQKEVREILSPAIKEPTKLLMDLLAGMSYVLQIETGEPLSERQITNINKGFTDDIGKIVLSYNTKLAEEAKKQ